MKATCPICPHACVLSEGQTGFCLGRVNRNGKVVSKNYGLLTSLALDPIEKKPFARFYPGSKILSAGSFGCNMKCPFCQNHDISYNDGKEDFPYVSPEKLIEIAVKEKTHGNIGLAFTYNEPFISYEYIRDCFLLAKQAGLKTILVTNGMINPAPLMYLMPYIDALNIDLKGFSQEIYDHLKGDLETVKNTIEIASKSAHVEVTSLIVPGFNDEKEDMEEQAKWLASINPDIPLHITRFFPRYMMINEQPTSLSLINDLVAIAKSHLTYVYKGNC